MSLRVLMIDCRIPGFNLTQKPDDDDNKRRALSEAMVRYNAFARDNADDEEGNSEDPTIDVAAESDSNNFEDQDVTGDLCPDGLSSCATDNELNDLPFDFDFLGADDTYTDNELYDSLNSTTNSTQRDATIDGFDYVLLVDESGEFGFADADDGNFYLVPADDAVNTTFASSDNIVVGAGDSLLMFYYPDEMTTMGVSRWRINEYNSIPKTAQTLALLPISESERDPCYIDR